MVTNDCRYLLHVYYLKIVSSSTQTTVSVVMRVVDFRQKVNVRRYVVF